MTEPEDRSAWRRNVLAEIFDHPEVDPAPWMEELADGELERVLASLHDSQELNDLLDKLRSGASARDL